VTDDLERQLRGYEVWLARQPFADNTRRAYRGPNIFTPRFPH